jgi:hypothetical protein
MLIVIACLNICACVHAQGVTLLYKNNMGWNDPLSWIQINAPVGQTPIQRVPTELDDVVINSSLSGIFSAGFVCDNINTDFFVGSNNTVGYRCKSMHISNTDLSFDNPIYIDGAPTINIYTSNGGYVIIDSGSNVHHGHFQLHGGNPAITDLQILHSTFGVLFSHANWSGLGWDAGARVRLVGSFLGGFAIGGYSGGNVYADSCTFETNSFILGDNSTDTLLNSTVTNNGNNVYLKFLIGRNSNFVSANVKVLSYSMLVFTTSGSELNGDIGTLGWGSGGFDIVQEDPTNPLTNIINGNITAAEMETLTIDGDLKISGNLSGFADAIINAPIPVLVNGQQVFTAGGFGGSGHYKLEFYGNTNSRITWNGGFPVDTLIINKTGCAKVTFDSSLYVSGATRIESGQLVLDPNDNIPYKFVCAGNVDIAQGGGLFMRKNAAGITANMAVGGTLTDHNLTADSVCTGLSNPYNGTITLYRSVLPVTLLDFYGTCRDKTVTLSWSTEEEVSTKYFTVERSSNQLSFHPLINIAASENGQNNKDYRYTDNASLNGINYYRLKMVDADGKFTYSKTIPVVVAGDNTITVFPNPVKDKLFIRLTGVPVQIEITVADAKGICIKKLQVKVRTSGASINTADLPAGVYSISFQYGKIKITRQFIKQ